MSKFAATPTTPRGAISTPAHATPDLQTFEGAPAYARDPKSELFTLAVVNMVSENSFYESAQSRDSRYVQLIHQVTKTDPQWMQSFIPWLRRSANMRSAPIVALAEYVAAKGPNGRRLILSTLTRADEPAELLAYWLNVHGRKLPAAIKRGIADAATALYNEYSVLKYDSALRGVRMADVLNLTHPKPKDAAQAELFKYVLDRRYDNTGEVDGAVLPIIAARHRLNALPRDQITAPMLSAAGATWEWWSSKGEMDAAAWEFVIPEMGYMATLRNLRNFEQAGVSDEVIERVRHRLADPTEVLNSRQFPYRFLSAYRATDSLTFARELEAALDMSCANIPALPGRTLVLSDVSGSMHHPVADRSSVQLWEIGALFAAALARKAEDVDLVAWATTHQHVPVSKTSSVLRVVESFRKLHSMGGGTNLDQALATFSNHDRIVVFTDLQIADLSRGGYGVFGGSRIDMNAKLASFGVPVYFFNLGGYKPTPVQLGAGIYEFGGFNDATFKIMPLLESKGWPWEEGK